MPAYNAVSYICLVTSNVLTMNEVSHFLFDQEGAIEIFDETLSEASTLAVIEVASLEVNVAFTEAVLNS